MIASRNERLFGRRFPYPRDRAGYLRYAPQVHRVVRHPIRRYDGNATAPPLVKGFGSHLLSTDARSRCLLGAPCRIRTLLTIRWRSAKACTGEFLITLIEKELAELPRGTRGFSARCICPEDGVWVLSSRWHAGDGRITAQADEARLARIAAGRSACRLHVSGRWLFLTGNRILWS